MSDLPFDLELVKAQFSLEGSYARHEEIKSGHINSTYALTFEEGGAEKKYTLQKINTGVFKDPEALMQNVVGVTSHLRKSLEAAGEDPERGTLRFHSCKNGKYCFEDAEGRCWRLYDYIGGVYTCDTSGSEEVFRGAGRAFGEFQRRLADYPMDRLAETIPDFHNTPHRLLNFKKSVAEDRVGRTKGVRGEIDFVLAREADTHVLTDLLEQGRLPLRVTHNDTKLNNILFDEKSGRGVCIIDLDTVMPGLSLYDFGDSIRYGANTGAEDEKDLSRVSLSLPLYRAYAEGYLSAVGRSLTDCELEYLPFSAKLMTLECGLRFLTDYLSGDTYFRTAYPEHNLVRARSQFALVEDLERKMGEMEKITASAAARRGGRRIPLTEE